MRPCRSTWVASTITRPAPEFASMPRWARCQSLATPSSALYWHIGEMTTRLSSARSARRYGENRAELMAIGLSRHEIDGGGEDEASVVCESDLHAAHCARKRSAS